MRLRIISALALSTALASAGAAMAEGQGEGAAAATDEQAVYHKVVPKDTLWDITEKYLDDPFKWPGVWKLNSHIKNPHLIYPGNIVKITPDGIEVLDASDAKSDGLPSVELEKDEKTVVLVPEAPAEPPAEEIAPLPPAPRLKDHFMARSGFISISELKGTGAIIEPREKKILATRGDEVFVSLRGDEAHAGDRFTIFKVGRRITHPATGNRLGHEIDILGSLTVTRVGEVVEAVIDNSFKEIMPGSRLKPYTEPVSEVEVTEAGAEVSGVVVTALEAKENLSTGDIAYIDKGSADGLMAGNMLRAYRPVASVPDPMERGKQVQLPPLELGTLLVIEAGESASTAIVVKSVKAISWGDRVSTLRAE